MIDHATVERIKGAANIVEVVSEFVTLRRAGANYKGLCPFHNEKTPSFIVSPARGTCHCFGCGRGGNAVGFIMEHEQFTYPEALRWLAQKYGIEVQERELTDAERQEQTTREAMFIVNEWASKYFEDQLHNTADGQALGMQYYRSRGFRDDIIARFHLGYDQRNRHTLAQQAQQKGYKTEYLVKTGLCYQTENGDLIDRFAERVVFPWHTLSGKVVGFSARLLDSRTKGVNQKYVNSPDSDIYHKERELFGVFQAKKSIAREDRVYIVEGQTDVLAMAQCGIENVVANSGTALSVHQINILHRFTENVTLLYDGDEAGQHAALRGTDMLLAEGMNVRVLLLPNGDDPDSYARKHTANEFRNYVENNQLDVIQYRTQFLLRHEQDPQQRTEAIDAIIRSISVVPNQVLRDTYLHTVAAAVGIKEATLINRMNVFIRERKASTGTAAAPAATGEKREAVSTIEPQIERMIAQLVVRNGEQIVAHDVEDDDGNRRALTLAQYVSLNLNADNLRLTTPVYQTIIDVLAQQETQEGFAAEQYLINHDDISLARTALALATDKYAPLQTDNSKQRANTDNAYDESGARSEQLRRQADHLLLDFRRDYIEKKLQEIKARMAQPNISPDAKSRLMADYAALLTTRNQLAQRVGMQVV